jgi:uncharacterized protein YjbI with pentapeptide repeats
MANIHQIAKIGEGAEGWNSWKTHETSPVLSGFQFSGRDFSYADFRAADLRGVDFGEANLSGATLREANLQGADLSGAKGGLQTEQFAGADLTGARLPEELKKLYEGLENVNNISESARKLFLAVLVACLYSWLTIATTTDLNLITNRASSPLPIIQTSIPIVGFYIVAPLLLLCVYFYFHLYLQKLWEELGSLPAILPDGRPLFAKIDPWLLNDLVRSHLPKLNVDRPFLSYLQLWISVLLAWWIVPITMLLFWGRYLARHELVGTLLHVAILMVAMTAGLRLYRLAVATLRGAEREPFRWSRILAIRRWLPTATFAVAVGMLFGIVSWGAIMGTPSNAPIFGIPVHQQGYTAEYDRRGPLTWVPRVMALFGYSPFANLTAAEISQKKTTWNKNATDPDSVTSAQLTGANLRNALAQGAFLEGATLKSADLSGIDLYRADMRGADLSDADLSGAELSLVTLQNAVLVGANLQNADLNPDDAGTGVSDLRNANFIRANFQNARMRNANLVGASLRATDLVSVDLSYADMSHANLQNANLQSAVLSDANLTSADFYDADLQKANLSGANLEAARLDGDYLNDAVLKSADLTRANLRGAELNGVQLDGANLTFSDFRGAKYLDFRAVKGALHWDKAFYDSAGLRALGLPINHNDVLSEQEKKATEPQGHAKSR